MLLYTVTAFVLMQVLFEDNSRVLKSSAVDDEESSEDPIAQPKVYQMSIKLVTAVQTRLRFSGRSQFLDLSLVNNPYEKE